jgi:hypothetical protein
MTMSRIRPLSRLPIARIWQLSKKAKIIVIGTCALLACTGVAVAYFTTTGAGTGSATVGTSAALTIHGTMPTTLYPGTSSSVSFTADNPSSGHQQVGTIHIASIKACPAGDTWNGAACTNAGVEIATCETVETGASSTNTANFWMPDVVSNQDLPTGNGQALVATGTLTMNDLNSSQNTCKSASLTVNFTS